MYHFVGIKGAGMSSLATIMSDLGYQVEGSDVAKHFFTEKGLIERNIKFFPYDAKNIKKGLTVIRGASITDDNVEIIAAKKLGLKIVSYEEMVGELTHKFKTICVCGCHGKTTTTAMLKTAFDKINYLIGDGTGYADVSNEFFALESCEYRRHFLNYLPYYTIITNIDLDHVDYFKDIDDVISAYQEFASKTIKTVVAYGDDINVRKLKIDNIIYFGITNNNDVIAKNIIYNNSGISFDVYIYGEFLSHFDLPLYGEHQLLDVLGVITVAYLEGLDMEKVNANLKKFTGARRRFTEDIVGESIIIDDYAHHPNEVKATIDAIKQKYQDKKIIAIFQPHTFSRTKEFANDLVKVFKMTDYTYILDIHPAREKQEDFPDVTSNIIINKLNNADHINIDEAKKLLKHKPAVYIFMSPNDLSKLENDLKKLLS